MIYSLSTKKSIENVKYKSNTHHLFLFKATRTRGKDLRVKFKNTHEAARQLKNKSLAQAEQFLRDVIDHKRAVPYYRFNGCIGRTAQAKGYGTPQARWPKKSALYLLDLLRNARANAEVKQLDISKLVVSHIQVNAAPRGRRRTNRAHGRINAYMSSPCHIEMILEENENVVSRGSLEEPSKKKKLSKKKEKREKAREGLTVDD